MIIGYQYKNKMNLVIIHFYFDKMLIHFYYKMIFEGYIFKSEIENILFCKFKKIIICLPFGKESYVPAFIAVYIEFSKLFCINDCEFKLR